MRIVEGRRYDHGEHGTVVVDVFEDGEVMFHSEVAETIPGVPKHHKQDEQEFHGSAEPLPVTISAPASAAEPATPGPGGE